ncbi:MAG: rRNA maturation RNase YbeY [Bacteroidota bacterium]
MAVQFFYLKGGFRFNNRTLLKKFIDNIFKAEGVKLHSLNYIFCSDEYLLQINKSYLNHDYYTDIITFDLSNSTGIVGEIYISIDRVVQNASTHKCTITQELHRVIFHGALHLCGYKDKSKRDSVLMRQMEDKYLTLYFN